jgi:lipopolysaccharide/colanic/teichoic acid biosynthesis glycosyltransferase
MAVGAARKHPRWALLAKRVADVVLAAAGLTVLCPLLAIMMLLVRLTSSGPVVYRQKRLGVQGRVFDLLKLRTMVQGAEQMGTGLAIAAGDSRITRLGRLLRSTSLDELPQLWNVLRGEMSLVGPRPLPVAYLGRFNERQRMRLLMPQGITGWAQVRGRNVASWGDRLEMDVWYVEHWSLGLDVRIMAETLWTVVARRDISASDGSVPEFSPQGGRPEAEDHSQGTG